MAHAEIMAKSTILTMMVAKLEFLCEQIMEAQTTDKVLNIECYLTINYLKRQIAYGYLSIYHNHSLLSY